MTFKEVREHLIRLQNQNTIKLNQAIEKIAQLEREQMCMIARQEKTETSVNRLYKLALVVLPFLTVAIPLITVSIEHIKVDQHEKIIIEQLAPSNGTHNPIRKP